MVFVTLDREQLLNKMRHGYREFHVELESVNLANIHPPHRAFYNDRIETSPCNRTAKERPPKPEPMTIARGRTVMMPPIRIVQPT